MGNTWYKNMIDAIKTAFVSRRVSGCRDLDREWYFVRLENKEFKIYKHMIYEMRIYWFVSLWFIGIGYGRDCIERDFR